MKNLFYIILILWLCSSCMTYRKAKARYAETKIDTITVTNTVTVPKDSIRFVIHNDTTTYIREYHQGRAKVIVEKTPTITYIKADCDSVTKTVEVKVPQQINTWGIAPWYRDGFIAVAALLFALIIYVITHRKRT
jgi:hypothetical protein